MGQKIEQLNPSLSIQADFGREESDTVQTSLEQCFSSARVGQVGLEGEVSPIVNSPLVTKCFSTKLPPVMDFGGTLQPLEAVCAKGTRSACCKCTRHYRTGDL